MLLWILFLKCFIICYRLKKSESILGPYSNNCARLQNVYFSDRGPACLVSSFLLSFSVGPNGWNSRLGVSPTLGINYVILGKILNLFEPVSLSAATAKLLQSCLTLCDPIDGSLSGSPVPGILQARTLEWVAISFSSAGKWKVKVKLLSRVRLSATPWTAAYQAPPSMGFSRQEYWSGVPLPSPPPSCFPPNPRQLLICFLPQWTGLFWIFHLKRIMTIYGLQWLASVLSRFIHIEARVSPPLLSVCLFFAWLSVPWPRTEPWPQQWKPRILTPSPPGKWKPRILTPSPLGNSPPLLTVIAK